MMKMMGGMPGGFGGGMSEMDMMKKMMSGGGSPFGDDGGDSDSDNDSELEDGELTPEMLRMMQAMGGGIGSSGMGVGGPSDDDMMR